MQRCAQIDLKLKMKSRKLFKSWMTKKYERIACMCGFVYADTQTRPHKETHQNKYELIYEVNVCVCISEK